MTSTAIVQKLWNYCNVLRDDGMSYGDYPSTRLRTGPSTELRAGVEQLTYLLFLKMADERTKPPYNQPSQIPDKYSWPSLLKKGGGDLVTAVETNLTRADRLRQSILSEAFSGRLVKERSNNHLSAIAT